MTVAVRRATAADAPAMGRAHVRAWRAAYRGHMPDDYQYSSAVVPQGEGEPLNSTDSARNGQDGLSVTSAGQVDKADGR